MFNVLSNFIGASGKKASKIFTVRKDYKNAKQEAEEYLFDAAEAMREKEYNEKMKKHENAREKGKAMAEIGASGVTASSYNDAMLYNTIKAEEELENDRLKADAAISQSLRKAKRAKKNAKYKHSLGLLDIYNS